jgi:transcriptional regulator with XRE-family HTH domain
MIFITPRNFFRKTVKGFGECSAFRAATGGPVSYQPIEWIVPMNSEDLTAEFVSLQNAMGWKNAEVARRLRITPASVSRIANGINPPSESLLELFRLIAFNERPELRRRMTQGLGDGFLRDGPTPSPWPVWSQGLFEMLEAMPPARRARALKSCRSVVDSIEETAAETLTYHDVTPAVQKAASDLLQASLEKILEERGNSGLDGYRLTDQPNPKASSEKPTSPKVLNGK